MMIFTPTSNLVKLVVPQPIKKRWPVGLPRYIMCINQLDRFCLICQLLILWLIHQPLQRYLPGKNTGLKKPGLTKTHGFPEKPRPAKKKTNKKPYTPGNDHISPKNGILSRWFFFSRLLGYVSIPWRVFPWPKFHSMNPGGNPTKSHQWPSSHKWQVFFVGIPDRKKMFHVILVVTSQHPGWGGRSKVYINPHYPYYRN